MTRTIVAGRCAVAHPDFFESGQRKQGLVWSDLQCTAFVDGSLLAWPLADGAYLASSTIGAGALYFNEIPGAAGHYCARFFPDRVGFWRLVLRHPTLGESVLEFDSVPGVAPVSGLNAQFGP